MTKQNVLDQVYHVVAGAALVLLASAGFIGAALAGLAIGLVRELSEAGGSRITVEEVKAHFTKGTDPYIDLVFWTLGGVLAGLIMGL